MIDIQNLFGAFSSSRQRATSNPPVQSRLMEKPRTAEEVGATPYPYQAKVGRANGNGAANAQMLPPFPPSIHRAPSREPMPNQSVPFNATSQASTANAKSLSRTLNGNASYSCNPQALPMYHTLQPNAAPLNSAKMYPLPQGAGGNYNTISPQNMPQVLPPNSLYLPNRYNSQFLSPILLPPYQNFNASNAYFNQGSGVPAASAAGPPPKMQNDFLDYLSMTYAGATGRNMTNQTFNHIPISRTIQVNRSELLPMRLIGDVVYKNVNLETFVGEGGAIRFYLLGEQIRHEYKSLSMIEFEAEKRFLKETTQIPIYKPPVLLHDNVTLYDTVSILRYLSKKMGQYGCDHLKDFVMDAISAVLFPWRTILDKAILASIEECEDSNNSFVTYLHERRTWYAKFEELLDSYIRKMRDMQIQHIVSNHEEELGGFREEKLNCFKEFDTFFTGKKPAFCDYILFSILVDDIKLLQDIKNKKIKDDQRKMRQAKEKMLEKEANEEDGENFKEDESSRKEEETEVSNEIVPSYFLSQCPRLLRLYNELKSHPHIEQFMIQLEESNKSDNEQENSSRSELNYSNNNSCNSESESAEENNEGEKVENVNRANNDIPRKENQGSSSHSEKVSQNYSCFHNMNNSAMIPNAFTKSNLNHVFNAECMNAYNSNSSASSFVRPKVIVSSAFENPNISNPLYDTLSMTYSGGVPTEGMYNYISAQPIPPFFPPQASFNPYMKFVHPSFISEPQQLHENPYYLPSLSAAHPNYNPHEYMTMNNYNTLNQLPIFRSKQNRLRNQKINQANTKLEEHKNSTLVTTTASTTHVDNHLADQLH